MPLTLLLHCTDLAQTGSFYDTALGFRVVASAGNTITVEKDGARLLFTGQPLWPAPTPRLAVLLSLIWMGIEALALQRGSADHEIRAHREEVIATARWWWRSCRWRSSWAT